MALSPIPEKRKAQVTAIERALATAPDIQDDLINYISKITEPYVKVIGQGSRIFDFAELVGYRINNSLLDIAEDLDLEERYDLINDQPKLSVGRAFRGHRLFSRVATMKFDGLFSKELNDMIEKSRDSINGRIGYANSLAKRTPEERFDDRQKGGLIGGRKAGLIGGRASIETHGDQMRNGGRATRGMGFWQTHPALLEDIVELRNEGLTWNDTTDEFNRRHGTDYKSDSLRSSYQNNKHLLADKEE